MDVKLKLVLVGPSKVGKTRIANYLAEFEENPNYESYNPTVSRTANTHLCTPYGIPLVYGAVFELRSPITADLGPGGVLVWAQPAAVRSALQSMQ